MNSATEPAAVVAADPKVAGMMRLRFRGDGHELDIDFEKAEDCRVVLASLADYFARRSAPHVATAPPPKSETPKAAGSVAKKESGLFSGSRREGIIDWLRSQGGTGRQRDLQAAFPDEWPNTAACWQTFAHWLKEEGCPIERAGRGTYRLRQGGGAPAADPAFRGAGADAPAAGQEADLAQVGADGE